MTPSTLRAMYAAQGFRPLLCRVVATCSLSEDAAPTMSSARTAQIDSSMSPWTSASFRRALSICSQTWCVSSGVVHFELDLGELEFVAAAAGARTVAALVSASPRICLSSSSNSLAFACALVGDVPPARCAGLQKQRSNEAVEERVHQGVHPSRFLSLGSENDLVDGLGDTLRTRSSLPRWALPTARRPTSRPASRGFGQGHTWCPSCTCTLVRCIGIAMHLHRGASRPPGTILHRAPRCIRPLMHLHQGASRPPGTEVHRAPRCIRPLRDTRSVVSDKRVS